MSRDLQADLIATLDDNVVYPFFAIELLFDDPNQLRLWTGLGELTYQGNTYTGTGSLLNITQVEETAELAVRGASITLSGVPSEVLSLALSTPYQGRICNVYFGMLFDENLATEYAANGFEPELVLDFTAELYRTTGPDITDSTFSQIFSGYMDQMNIEEGPETSTVELKVENKLIDLERARVRRYSSAYQKSVYPGDKGLDFVEDLQDKEIVWGRKVGK